MFVPLQDVERAAGLVAQHCRAWPGHRHCFVALAYESPLGYVHAVVDWLFRQAVIQPLLDEAARECVRW